MGKRGNGAGSLYSDKAGRWYVAITLDDGTRLRERAADQLDAESKLAGLRARKARGTAAKPTRLTVAGWMREWIDSKGKLASSSKRIYSDRLRLYITPRLGGIRLEKLTPADLRALSAYLARQGYAASTIAGIHTNIQSALDQAVLDGLVSSNVARRAKPDLDITSTKTMIILTPSQARQFAAVIAGDRYEALWLLLLYTGIRLGEGLALTWGAIDIERRVLKIEATLQKGELSKLGTSDGKTKHARRTLVLPEALVEPLKAHRKRIGAEMMAFGREEWGALDLVFPNQSGQLARQSTVSYTSLARALTALNRQAKEADPKAGFPRFTPHDLRHTYATRLLEAGVPLIFVSRQLGHSSIKITADLYGHTVQSMMDETAAAASRIFDSPPGASEAIVADSP